MTQIAGLWGGGPAASRDQGTEAPPRGGGEGATLELPASRSRHVLGGPVLRERVAAGLGAHEPDLLGETLIGPSPCGFG